MSRTKLHGALLHLLGAAALLAGPLEVLAGDFSLMLQPGMAVPLPAARSPGLGLGSVGSLKALLGLGRCVDVEFGVGFIGLPMASAELSSLTGMATTYGAGLRLRRPHDLRSFLGASPWLEAEALYVQAGHLQGAGFAVGAGVAFPIGPARKVWLGPFVRYLDILEPDRANPDRPGSRTVFTGVTLEIVMGR